jgi:hypothetical protein
LVNHVERWTMDEVEVEQQLACAASPIVALAADLLP